MAVVATPSQADERIFGYVFTTDSMPQDKWEVQNWLRVRLHQSHGDYQLYQLANGANYGVSSDFQLGIFINSHHVTADRNSIQGRTSGAYVPDNAAPDRTYSSVRFDSVSLPSKYRLMSPYIDDVGVAIFAEPSIGSRENGLAYGVIVQSNFLDDTLVFAANVVATHVWKYRNASTVAVYDPSAPGGPARWDGGSYLDFTFGASYRFVENWFAGLEFRNRNQFSGASFQHAGYSAFFLGPNLHYGGRRFWATLTVLPQLPFAAAHSADQRNVLDNNRIFGSEHEKLEVRLGVGIPF